MAGVRHPLFARAYHRMRQQEDRLGVTDQRLELLDQLSGRVLEVGAGDGANLPFYPAAVTEVVAVEPEPYLRGQARLAAAKALVPVTVLDGTAELLPVEDASFDAVVSSLVLCSVKDPGLAVAEMLRVLRPRGEIRFLEHVRANSRWLALAQDLASPVQARLGGGCHPNRETVRTLTDAGLVMVSIRHFDFYPTPLAVLDRHRVIGRARHPATAD